MRDLKGLDLEVLRWELYRTTSREPVGITPILLYSTMGRLQRRFTIAMWFMLS